MAETKKKLKDMDKKITFANLHIGFVHDAEEVCYFMTVSEGLPDPYEKTETGQWAKFHVPNFEEVDVELKDRILQCEKYLLNVLDIPGITLAYSDRAVMCNTEDKKDGG